MLTENLQVQYSKHFLFSPEPFGSELLTWYLTTSKIFSVYFSRNKDIPSP